MCVCTSGTPAHRNANLCTPKLEGCASLCALAPGEGCRASRDTPALTPKGILPEVVNGEDRKMSGCAATQPSPGEAGILGCAS